MLRLYDLAYQSGEHEALVKAAENAIQTFQVETKCYLDPRDPCIGCKYRHVCEDFYQLAQFAKNRLKQKEVKK